MALARTSVTLLMKSRDWNIFKKESLLKSGFHLILTAVRRESLLPRFTDEGYREVKHSTHTHTAEAAEQDLKPGCSKASVRFAPHRASTNPTLRGQDPHSGGGAEVMNGAWT